MENQPPGAGLILRAAVTINSEPLAKALGLPGSKIPRGVEVDPALLREVRNADVLISSGMLRWCVPTAPRSATPDVALNVAPHGNEPDLSSLV